MLSNPRLLFSLGCTLFLSALLPLGALDFSDLGAAEQELEELSAEWQSSHESEPSDDSGENLALTLQTLGIVERQRGKPAEALDHLTAASDLLETLAPGLLPDCLEAKALTLQDLGRLEESETLLHEVLEFRRSSSSDRIDPALAATLDHLALNLLYQGRYPEVAPLLQQAIDATGENDPAALAQLLDHRGRLHHTLGSHARAIDEFRRRQKIPVTV